MERCMPVDMMLMSRCYLEPLSYFNHGRMT
uniref:Uncharacterized protein n=1 Tax=Arundo donax TaxID=35708 RepID=A0A0A8YH21_ARUDO